jgi:hypothetical protein
MATATTTRMAALAAARARRRDATRARRDAGATR